VNALLTDDLDRPVDGRWLDDIKHLRNDIGKSNEVRFWSSSLDDSPGEGACWARVGYRDIAMACRRQAVDLLRGLGVIAYTE
jgi:hypothetical protein